jgi:phage tail sheath protein FI
VRDLGQVIVEVGLAPTRPAEFIILRFGLWEGGARVTEG